MLLLFLWVQDDPVRVEGVSRRRALAQRFRVRCTRRRMTEVLRRSAALPCARGVGGYRYGAPLHHYPRSRQGCGDGARDRVHLRHVGFVLSVAGIPTAMNTADTCASAVLNSPVNGNLRPDGWLVPAGTARRSAPRTCPGSRKGGFPSVELVGPNLRLMPRSACSSERLAIW